MKNKGFLLSGLIVMAILAIVTNASYAQDPPAQLQMHQNLRDMSEMLKDISVQLSSGKMTSAAQKAAGKITRQVGLLLEELAGIGNETHAKHQTQIEEMKKSWDPFAEEAATND